MLKQLRTLLISTILGFCGAPSFAAGQFDGVYVYTNQGQTQFLSVHQNGSDILGAGFWTIPASGIVFNFADGQTINPTRLDVWDLYTGTLSGNQVVLSGETKYGACFLSYLVAFDSTGANISRRGMITTSFGKSKGINCESYYSSIVRAYGTSFRATRVF